MGKSTPELRKLWKQFECAAPNMIAVPFGPDTIRVAPPTKEAWTALAAVLTRFNYQIRTADTDSYNCRTITGGTEKSLHSYGIALDVNWTTNPYIDHAGDRACRFSNKLTQATRALDVKHALADTDMTPAMLDAVRAIRTNGAKQVFEWGGDWRNVKDCMHFEIDVGPSDLAQGIDWSTVVGGEPDSASLVVHPQFRVMTRDTLNLRAGPGTIFSVKQSLAPNTILGVMGREGDWAMIDLKNDGQADGYVFASYLRAVD